jgi:hypothetical protein
MRVINYGCVGGAGEAPVRVGSCAGRVRPGDGMGTLFPLEVQTAPPACMQLERGG